MWWPEHCHLSNCSINCYFLDIDFIHYMMQHNSGKKSEPMSVHSLCRYLCNGMNRYPNFVCKRFLSCKVLRFYLLIISTSTLNTEYVVDTGYIQTAIRRALA